MDCQFYKKKAIRIISKAKYLDHTEPLCKELELLNLDKTYRLNCLLFMYKLINLNLHKSIKRRIVRNSDIHNHRTRNRSKYRLPGTRLKCVRQSCLYFGLSLWNRISKDIIESKPWNPILVANKLQCADFRAILVVWQFPTCPIPL